MQSLLLQMELASAWDDLGVFARLVCWSLVLFHPKQIFKQVILSVDEHRIPGTNAASVAQDSRRRFVAFAYRSQIAVNQRLHDAFRAFAVLRRTRRIFFRGGETKQSAGHDGSRR